MKIKLISLKGTIVKVNLLVFPVTAAAILSGNLEKYLIIKSTIMLHEFGHIIVSKLSGRQTGVISVLPVGLSADVQYGNSRIINILIYMSGPAVNLLIVFAAVLIYSAPGGPQLEYLIKVNLFLGFFNLLPVLPLDGGRILGEILAVNRGIFSAYRQVKIVTLIFIPLLLAAGILQFIYGRQNFSIIAIAIYILASLKSYKMGVSLMNIKNLLFRRTRFLNKGIYPVRDMAVLKATKVRDIIKELDFDRFHIVYIIDEDFKVAGMVTEHQIIELSAKSSSDMTFGDIIL